MDNTATAQENPAMEKEIGVKLEEPELISEQLTSSKASLHDSEYESVDSGDNYSEEEDNHPPHSGDSGHSGSESGNGSVILEREEGDGQESIPVRKVDDDQDKKNPQYIPKRGTFYEHDDRTADDVDSPDVKEAEKLEKENKKKVWQEKERWSHDKFNDNEQAPKSKAELISIYGYDIRNEDGPPRARRRRRYGRGPNKYTRNWEDEDAYNKPSIKTKKKVPRKQKGKQNDSDQNSEQSNPEVKNEAPIKPQSPNGHSQSNRTENVEQPPQQPTVKQEHVPQENNSKNANTAQIDKQNNKNQSRVGTGRVMKPQREIKDSDYRGFTRPRQFKSNKSEPQNTPPRNDKQQRQEYVHTQNYSNKNVQQNVHELEKDMGKLNVYEGGNSNYKNKHNNSNNNQRQASVPPRLQSEQKGSKRYSSMRQRSLPETSNPPLNLQHPNYYPADYQQQNPGQQSALLQHQGTPIHATTAQMPQIAPPPLAPIPQQVPVTNTPILQAPPQFAAPFSQPPPPFLPPAVATPPFLAQQSPQIINYVPSQPQFSQPPYTEFQQQFNPVTQAPELFTSPGITYYNPQQQSGQRPAPQKRPKAAIPIVAPPPFEPRGRGRANQAELASPNNSSESNTETSTTPQEEAVANFEDAPVAAAKQ